MRPGIPRRNFLCLVAILSSLTGTAALADNVVLKAGMGVLAIRKADNLWSEGKSDIASLGDRPAAVTKLYPFPTLEAGYEDARTRTEYYVIVSMDDPGCLTVGAERKLDGDSSFDIYGFYSLIAREWRDPYVLHREATRSEEYGIKTTYENVANSGLVLSYKLTAIQIGRDDSGALHPELRRNGTVHNGSVGFRPFPFLEAGVAYERGAYEGGSNRYDRGELYLGLNYQDGDFLIGARAAMGNARFDREHPVFGVTRKESGYTIDLKGGIGKPFGQTHYSVIFGSSVERSHSNIAFFDRSERLGWVGLEYSRD